MLRRTLAMASFSFVLFGATGIGLSYEVIDVSQGATIAGQVGFTGNIPAPRVFEVKQEPAVCGELRGLTKVDVHQGRLKGAVVVLEGVEKGKAFEARTFHATAPGEGTFRYNEGHNIALDVSLKNCNFGPFTGVVAADEPIHFENHDPIKHTLHTYVVKGQKANILRTLNTRNLAAHSEVDQELPPGKLKNGRVVALTCDRHDFMENWMYIVESPYYAISDESGKFTLDHVPPGEYDLVVWHPVLGTQQQTVRVDAGGHIEANFTFSK